jgi:membrane carboxypeptidase/penicillin-binding protein
VVPGTCARSSRDCSGTTRAVAGPDPGVPGSDKQRLHGAGTITMQCARNVFLWQGRSYMHSGAMSG